MIQIAAKCVVADKNAHTFRLNNTKKPAGEI